jgi:hypothetical protein
VQENRSAHAALSSAVRPLGVLDRDVCARLLTRWVDCRMGNTGPTLPFLLGANRKFDELHEVADVSDLSKMLYDLQEFSTHYVLIKECDRLHQPVVGLYKPGTTMEAQELIERPKGKSALYVSRKYPHRQDIQSVCDTFWPKIEAAVTDRRYSHDGKDYGAYTSKERAYIARCQAA